MDVLANGGGPRRQSHRSRRPSSARGLRQHPARLERFDGAASTRSSRNSSAVPATAPPRRAKVTVGRTASSRPGWILDEGPAGGESAYTSTWAVGPLGEGRTRRVEFKLTAVQAGSYMVAWRLALRWKAT